MILLTRSPGSSKSFQEAPRKLQKIQGRNPGNNFVGILDETFKDIIKLTDLYLGQQLPQGESLYPIGLKSA
jgi:hypothetical protein